MWGAHVFESGLLIALPAVIALVIVNLALGVVTRAAPQLNLFGIGFTITLLCGFFVLIVGLDGIMAGIASLINSALRRRRRPGARAGRGSALMAAEAETGGERTEEPSQRRLQEARERGQVPRSRELTNFATMIGGSAALVAIGGALSPACRG